MPFYYTKVFRKGQELSCVKFLQNSTFEILYESKKLDFTWDISILQKKVLNKFKTFFCKILTYLTTFFISS